MGNRVAVVGAGISRFDNPPRFELHEELCAEAVREMLADNPNIDFPKDIDAFYDLVKRHKLEFTLTNMTKLLNYRDSIQLYNPNLNTKQIQEWIKTIVK